MNFSRRALRLAAVVAIVSGLVAHASRVQAAEAEPSVLPRSARASVRVRVVGELGHDPVLQQRIVSWFDPATLDLKVESVPRMESRDILTPTGGALVEVWVTRRGPKLARLYFASESPDTGQVRYLLRDLELERGLDEVAAEEIAQSVHLSTVALLEGQLESSRAEVERALQAEAQAEAVVTTRSAATPRVTIPEPAAKMPKSEPNLPTGTSCVLVPALGYGVDFLGDEGVGHGPRARLHAGLPSGWGLDARLQLTLPHSVQLPELELELWGGSALLGAGYRHRAHRLWTIAGFAGMSLELLRYTARARPGVAFTPAPPESELRPRAVLGALVAFGSSPRLALATELGLALGRTSYESARGGQRREVAHASRLMPSLGLELEL